LALITSCHLSSADHTNSSPRCTSDQLSHVHSNTQPKFVETTGVVHGKRYNG